MDNKKGNTNPGESQQDTKRTPADSEGFTDQIIKESGVIKPTEKVEKESALSPELKKVLLGEEDSKEEVKEEVEDDILKDRESEEVNRYKSKINDIVKKIQVRVDEINKILPNTKDPSKKLELEREVFKHEKDIHDLTKDLDVRETPDLGKVDAIFADTGISKDGESYKLVQKMMSHKASKDLLKIFEMSAKALSADLKKKPEPVDITTTVKDTPRNNQPFFDEDSFVGKIVKNLNKKD